MDNRFVKISFSAEWLRQTNLPDIQYPVPINAMETITASGSFGLEQMLFWIQEYSEEEPDEWLDYEEAMLKIAVRLSPYDPRPRISIFGDNWFLTCGKVDLTKEIVTIQRKGILIAAIQNNGDGRLLVSSYRPLDSKAVRYLIGLANNPAPDGTVCMRPNNWEYALDNSATMGNVYASEAGESYLSYWEFGMGLSRDKTRVDAWYPQRWCASISPNILATQILINYKNAEN